MKKTPAKSQRRKRKPMFTKGRTVSFKLDGDKADAAQQAAYDRNIPFSMWMRDATIEKMERERIAAAVGGRSHK